MPHRRLSVTVLGSGGPIANPHRVSAGYILSIDGNPRILVDAGGGTFERIET
jgi:ribonuclease BN (tRNA processing enzyme)